MVYLQLGIPEVEGPNFVTGVIRAEVSLGTSTPMETSNDARAGRKRRGSSQMYKQRVKDTRMMSRV
jgi:hypothetical protein